MNKISKTALMLALATGILAAESESLEGGEMETRCVRPEMAANRGVLKYKTEAEQAEYQELMEAYDRERKTYRECIARELDGEIDFGDTDTSGERIGVEKMKPDISLDGEDATEYEAEENRGAE